MAISAVQIWTFRALALVRTKVLIVRFCFRALKNSSICQRSLENCMAANCPPAREPAGVALGVRPLDQRLETRSAETA